MYFSRKVNLSTKKWRTRNTSQGILNIIAVPNPTPKNPFGQIFSDQPTPSPFVFLFEISIYIGFAVFWALTGLSEV